LVLIDFICLFYVNYLEFIGISEMTLEKINNPSSPIRKWMQAKKILFRSKDVERDISETKIRMLDISIGMIKDFINYFEIFDRIVSIHELMIEKEKELIVFVNLVQ
jgi:hypothetical protein